jgi:hypothetical protein
MDQGEKIFIDLTVDADEKNAAEDTYAPPAAKRRKRDVNKGTTPTPVSGALLAQLLQLHETGVGDVATNDEADLDRLQIVVKRISKALKERRKELRQLVKNCTLCDAACYKDEYNTSNNCVDCGNTTCEECRVNCEGDCGETLCPNCLSSTGCGRPIDGCSGCVVSYRDMCSCRSCM